MIIYKNTAGQYVYSRVLSITGGAQSLVSGLSGASQNGLTGYISKNGGSEIVISNPIEEVGHGMYKLLLTQNETNCDTGVVQMTVGPTSWYQFDPVYFQTTNPTPSVSITGSSITNIISAIKGATYDGNITNEKVNEMFISFLLGAVDKTSQSGVDTFFFKNAAGLTSFRSYCSTTTGLRETRGITG